MPYITENENQERHLALQKAEDERDELKKIAGLMVLWDRGDGDDGKLISEACSKSRAFLRKKYGYESPEFEAYLVNVLKES